MLVSEVSEFFGQRIWRPFMILERIRARIQALLNGQPPAPSIVTNAENIVWTDWKGRERSMSIKREVR